MTVFAAIFVPDDLRAATSDQAWLEAMLDAERALASAEAIAGAIPADAAAAISDSCSAELFDIEELSRQGRATGNPAEPLVRALRERVGGDAARFVHFGATSQDILDSAAMVVSQKSLGLILFELAGLATECARLAETHRSTPMAGRTLLQQAVPTTFGAKAAGWLVGVVEAQARLDEVRTTRLAVQLGGAAGTLAPLGEHGLEVQRLFALELDLAEPVVPWHAHRGRIAELASALDVAAAAAGKIGLDVALLSQTEIAEVSEGAPGGSSTMPQKRNPVRSTIARACGLRVHAASTLLAGGMHEHERAAGAWHAEWAALSEALALTGGAAASMREGLATLEVHADRMRENIRDETLAERIGFWPPAEDVSEELLDPTTYLGSAGAFVDRALALYREQL